MDGGRVPALRKRASLSTGADHDAEYPFPLTGGHFEGEAPLQRIRQSIQHRKTSATLQACAMHPRGVKGGSASKISLIDPTQACFKWSSKPSRNLPAPSKSPG